MKFLNLSFLLSIVVFMLISCADYNLLDESLHPTPVQLKIINTGDSTVTLRWTQYLGEDFKNYKAYSGQTDACDSLTDTLSFRTDTLTTVRRLSPLTHYYFRVIVTTKQGGVGASNVVDTTIELSANRILTLYPPDSSAISDSTVLLRWSKCTADFDVYKIYRDTTNSVDTKDTSVKTVYTDTSATITGLLQGRTYWFKVYAIKDTSIAATSAVLEVQTKNVTQSWPGALSVVNVTDTSVLLRWTHYPGNDFKNYKVYFSRNPTVELRDSLEDSLVVASDTMMIVRSLLPGTAYAFRVMVATLRGQVLYSNNAQVTTTNSMSGKIKLFGPDKVDSNLVVLRWTQAVPKPDSYWIFKGATQQVNESDSMAVPLCVDTFAVVKNLAPNTIYWFRVFAKTGADYVASSNPVEVLTSGY